MIKNYTLKKIDKHSVEIQSFFDDIDRVWFERGGEDSIQEAMKDKVFREMKFKVYPFLLDYNGEAVGLVWVELSTDSYGNITFHIPEKEHIEPAVFLLKQEGFFKKRIMEIVQVHDHSYYKDACYKQGLIPNIRQRMCLWLNECDTFEEEDMPVEFYSMTKDNLEWSGALSAKAHLVSRDYDHYDEMKDVQKRIELEKVVWEGLYGKIIEEASIVLFYQDKPVGYCYLVEVESWGFKRVPWIFDICIDPAYHGQGFGKALSKKILNLLIEMDYEIMGLAATKTNSYAIKLYEQLGFQYVDTFYEFLEP